jgi:hypothetical protein
MFVVNLTADTLSCVIPDYYRKTVDFHITDSSGHYLSYSGGMVDLRRICQQTLLLPRDTLVGLVDLDYCYGQPLATEERSMIGLLPGSYTVSGTYLDRMTSKTLQFSVAEATGSEREAIELLQRAYEGRYSHRFQKMAGTIEELLSRFPQSPYAPQALDILSGVYNNSERYDVSAIVKTSKRLITTYPDNPRCSRALARVMRLQTLEENRSYLQSVIAAKSGTWAARVARWWLTRPQLKEMGSDREKYKDVRKK